MVVGIRPERLSLAEQVTEGDWSVSGVTDVVEMLGAEQYVHFTADGGSLTARRAARSSGARAAGGDVRRRIPASVSVRPGDG